MKSRIIEVYLGFKSSSFYCILGSYCAEMFFVFLGNNVLYIAGILLWHREVWCPNARRSLVLWHRRPVVSVAMFSWQYKKCNMRVFPLNGAKHTLCPRRVGGWFLVLLKRVKVWQQWRPVLWLHCWGFQAWRESELSAPRGLSSEKSCEKIHEGVTNKPLDAQLHSCSRWKASFFYLYIRMTLEQTNNDYDGFPKGTNYPLQLCCSIATV